jgi:peptidoglycan/LPS O-acetylase OafA/YrhL
VSNATALGSGLLGFGAGQIGVMLFFVLSGFLMGSLYLNKAFNRNNVWHFAVRRFARVIPLYYAILTAALVLAGLSHWLGRDVTIYPIQPYDLISHYYLLSGESVFWTIPIEIHFYGAFLIIWWLYGKSQLLFSLFVGSVILWYFMRQANTAAIPQFLDYIAYFLGGVAISLTTSKLRAGRLWNIVFVSAGALSLLLFPSIYARSFGQARWADFGQMWHDPLCLVAVSAVLATSLLAPVAKLVLANRFMVYSGRISYSVYLVHVPVIIWLTRFTFASQVPIFFLLLALVLTIAIASVSYRWLECPMRGAITRAGRLANPAVTIGATPSFGGAGASVGDGDRCLTP